MSNQGCESRGLKPIAWTALPPDMHRQLKILATARCMTLQDYVAGILIQAVEAGCPVFIESELACLLSAMRVIYD